MTAAQPGIMMVVVVVIVIVVIIGMSDMVMLDMVAMANVGDWQLDGRVIKPLHLFTFV